MDTGSATAPAKPQWAAAYNNPCLYGILEAMRKAEEHLGITTPPSWMGFNPFQEEVIGALDMYRGEAGLIPELSSIASRYTEDINKFLREAGFNIQLGELGSDEFGVAAILDLKLAWLRPGTATTLQDQQGVTREALKLGSGMITVFEHKDLSFPLIEIRTQSDDVVFVSESPLADTRQMVLDREELFSRAHYTEVALPMVDYRKQADITPLIGMGLGRWIVTQALQENILRVNEIGARAQSATAMGMTRGLNLSRPYTVTNPFSFLVIRPGLSYPLFGAFIEPDSWKNPGSLD